MHFDSNLLGPNLNTMGDHSFPERHFGPKDQTIDQMANMGWAEPGNGLDTTHWGESAQLDPLHAPPKMGTLEPDFSSLCSQDWLGPISLSLHRGQHRDPHKFEASNPPPPPSHDIFTSPIQETTSPVHQTELDLLWSQGIAVRSPSGFVSLSQAQSQHATSSKGEDDSDSIWSLNDSLEDYFQPLPGPLSWHAPPQAARFRRRSVPRVTKPGSSRPIQHSQQLRHTINIHGNGNGNRHAMRALHGSIDTVTPITLNQHHTPPNGAYDPSSYDNSQSTIPRSEVSGDGDGDGEDGPSKLLSKRIAHKLSEKTRRNRLTVAIREIEKLLPPTQTSENDDGDHQSGDEQSPQVEKIQFIPGGNAVSKVDVVEMAIGYIKKLEAENSKMASRAEKAEVELRKLRKEGDTAGEK